EGTLAQLGRLTPEPTEAGRAAPSCGRVPATTRAPPRPSAPREQSRWPAVSETGHIAPECASDHSDARVLLCQHTHWEVGQVERVKAAIVRAIEGDPCPTAKHLAQLERMASVRVPERPRIGLFKLIEKAGSPGTGISIEGIDRSGIEIEAGAQIGRLGDRV